MSIDAGSEHSARATAIIDVFQQLIIHSVIIHTGGGSGNHTCCVAAISARRYFLSPILSTDLLASCITRQLLAKTFGHSGNKQQVKPSEFWQPSPWLPLVSVNTATCRTGCINYSACKLVYCRRRNRITTGTHDVHSWGWVDFDVIANQMTRNFSRIHENST